MSPDSAVAAAAVIVPVPGLTQMVSPWWPLVAHDAGAVPSIVSAASAAMHSRAFIFMLVL